MATVSNDELQGLSKEIMDVVSQSKTALKPREIQKLLSKKKSTILSTTELRDCILWLLNRDYLALTPERRLERANHD